MATQTLVANELTKSKTPKSFPWKPVLVLVAAYFISQWVIGYLWQLDINAGDKAFIEHNYPKAIAEYRQAITKTYWLPFSGGKKNTSLGSILLVYDACGQHNEAATIAKQLSSDSVNVFGNHDLSVELYKSGKRRLKNAQPTETEILWQRALSFERPTFINGYYSLMIKLGDLYAAEGKYAKALKYFKKALNEAKKESADEKMIGNALRKLAVLNFSLHDYSSAQYYAKKALIVYNTISEDAWDEDIDDPYEDSKSYEFKKQSNIDSKATVVKKLNQILATSSRAAGKADIATLPVQHKLSFAELREPEKEPRTLLDKFIALSELCWRVIFALASGNLLGWGAVFYVFSTIYQSGQTSAKNQNELVGPRGLNWNNLKQRPLLVLLCALLVCRMPVLLKSISWVGAVLSARVAELNRDLPTVEKSYKRAQTALDVAADCWDITPAKSYNLQNLTEVLIRQNKYDEAEQTIQRAIHDETNDYGRLSQLYSIYADLLQRMGRSAEAEEMALKAKRESKAEDDYYDAMSDAAEQ